MSIRNDSIRIYNIYIMTRDHRLCDKTNVYIIMRLTWADVGNRNRKTHERRVKEQSVTQHLSMDTPTRYKRQSGRGSKDPDLPPLEFKKSRTNALSIKFLL